MQLHISHPQHHLPLLTDVSKYRLHDTGASMQLQQQQIHAITISNKHRMGCEAQLAQKCPFTPNVLTGDFDPQSRSD